MSASARDYELLAPETLPEVLSLLTKNWRPIAGGTDLMVLLNAGQMPFKNLVSLQRIRELQTIEVNESFVSIGAGVTYTAIRNHPVLQHEFELLCRAAAWTGGIANQNRGTLGGNIMNASPAADSPPMLMVYDAELELISERGARRVTYEYFHKGYKIMEIQPDELLTRIVLPRRITPPVTYARKVGTRKAMAISKVCMGALAWKENGRVSDVRIAVGSVAPIPLRCRATESVLMNSILSDDIRAQAREALAAEISPIDDIRSTSTYRRQVTLNLLSEFLDLLEWKDNLSKWNALSPETAESIILKCCGSSRWARQLVAARPFENLTHLRETADEIWWSLAPEDWLEAFQSHPQIGAVASKAWESREQSGMRSAATDIRRAFAQANAAYQAKFGFIYIVCATGKTAEEMLANLRQRLENTQEIELREGAEQQRQIMQLRLSKWLNG